jgi:hypothetical protein
METALALVSAVLAAAVVVMLARQIPATNQAHTDILGYPTYANFNGNQYSDYWYLGIIGWPLLSGLIYIVGRRFLRVSGLLGRISFAPHSARARPQPMPPPDEISSHPDSLPERVALVGRVVGVALVWGFVGAIVRGSQDLRFWRDLVVVAAVYVAILLLAVAALSSRKESRLRFLRAMPLVSTLNAVGAALTVAGLLAVSQRTTLTTLSDNVQHPIHWLPVGLGILLTALSVGAVGVGLWRARNAGPERTRSVERRALFLLAVPVALFLTTAVLEGDQPGWNVFEAGQQLVTLRLIHLGEIPYRDFLPFHGLMMDTLFNALGYRLISASAWGAFVGAGLFIVPLSWVANYLFAYRVAGVSWVALLTTLLLFFNSTLMAAGERLMFWPLILVLLSVAFDRRSAIVSFCAGAAVTIFALLVPEATYAVPAFGIALLAHDAYHAGWPGPRVIRAFRLTLWAVAGGMVVTSCLFVILIAEHAVGGFIDFYVTQVPGHFLEGALPISITPMTAQFLFWIVAPGVATMLAFSIVALRIRLRLRLRTNDFLMVAAGVFTILYYAAEFLARADAGHADVAYSGAIPLLMLCGWEVLRWLNGWVRARLRGSDAGHLRWPVVYVAAAIAGITATTSIPTLVAAAPSNFRPTAASEPWLPSVGYIANTDEAVSSDVGTFLSTFLKPGANIYDFSNQPGLYFYILDYRPASRHFFTGTDYSEASQDETIADLEVNHPEFVIMFGSAFGALPSWDGLSNAVRDYAISQYVLGHYRPFADVDGQIIYIQDKTTVSIPAWLRSELGSALTLTDLPFQYPTCSWGNTPAFLDVQPPLGDTSVTVGGGTNPSQGWTLTEPSGHSWAEYHWIQLTIAPGSLGAAYTLDDQEVAGESHDITFQTLPLGQTLVRFPIGACTQWWGYSLPTLHLSSSASVTISQVKLLP